MGIYSPFLLSRSNLEENHQILFQNIPSNITSAADILERGLISFEPAFQIHINEEAQQNLAQAAREGKEISDEVRKQMQQDRLNALKRNGKNDTVGTKVNHIIFS